MTTLLFELPEALGRPDSFAGVLMAVQGIGAIAGAFTATRVIARRGERALAGLGMTIFAIGTLAMADPRSSSCSPERCSTASACRGS